MLANGATLWFSLIWNVGVQDTNQDSAFALGSDYLKRTANNATPMNSAGGYGIGVEIGGTPGWLPLRGRRQSGLSAGLRMWPPVRCSCW